MLITIPDSKTFAVNDYGIVLRIVIRDINKTDDQKIVCFYLFSIRPRWIINRKPVQFEFINFNFQNISEETGKKQNIQEGNNTANYEHYPCGGFRINILSHDFARRSKVDLQKNGKRKLYAKYHL